MIEKIDLLNCRYYSGICRNTNIAMWYNNEFIFLNFQFTNIYIEKICHYSDVKDSNIDGFIPIKLIDSDYNLIQNEKKEQDYKNVYRKMYLNFKLELFGETWKDIYDYEGLYQVSDFGRIKNIKTNTILRQNFSRGYLILGLTKNKKRKTFRVHRLVALTFKFNNKYKDLEINHKNGIKTDNRDVNLEWTTHIENSNKTFSSGNRVKKLTVDNVLEIKLLLKNKEFTQKQIAKKFNICESIISNIKLGKKWVDI